MTRTHVLLDLDGTISDSSAGIGRSLDHALVRHGYTPLTPDQLRSVIGPPFEVSFPALGIADDHIAPIVDAYRERYDSVGLYENELYDGVPDMVEQLAATFTLGLATAKPEPNAVRIVRHFGLDRHFTVQAGASGELGSDRRTKAQVIEHALALLGTEAGDHVVMVGDRDHDVEGAIENGIDCIGVSWGFGSRDELLGAGARIVVDSPAEVVGAVAATYGSGER